MSFNIGVILGNEEANRGDYFAILGCSETSTPEQIATEYRVRALKCHPDKNPGNEQALQEFQKLQEARDVLTDPELRKSFDKWKQSEICIPFKKWLSMNQRCTTVRNENKQKCLTMHWAKPKDQTMLETTSTYDRLAREEMCRDPHLRPQPTAFGGDIRRGSKQGWESDNTSSVYKEFRNYKI